MISKLKKANTKEKEQISKLKLKKANTKEKEQTRLLDVFSILEGASTQHCKFLNQWNCVYLAKETL